MYKIIFSKIAAKHKPLLKSAGLEAKAKLLLNLIAENPFKTPPPFEKLVGDLAGVYSRRLNHQHRLVYTVDKENETIHVLSMWTHYEF